MSERPTPITDAYIGDFNDDDMTEGEIAMCEFARNLERQLSEAREEISRIRKFATVNGVAELERQLDEARKQRDALAEALKRTTSDIITFQNIARVNRIVGTLEVESLELAATALAAVKGTTPEP